MKIESPGYACHLPDQPEGGKADEDCSAYFKPQDIVSLSGARKSISGGSNERGSMSTRNAAQTRALLEDYLNDKTINELLKHVDIDNKTIFEAIKFATRAHAGQFRKGGKVPYLFHPVRVAIMLARSGCGNDIIAAGVLHDTVEDTPATCADIRKKFGPDICLLVEGASEKDKNAPWEERKQQTIDEVQTAPREVILVELADKFDNIIGIRRGVNRAGESYWNRFNRGREKQQWYYCSLADEFAARIKDEPGLALYKSFRENVDALFGRQA